MADIAGKHLFALQIVIQGLLTMDKTARQIANLIMTFKQRRLFEIFCSGYFFPKERPAAKPDAWKA